METDKIVETDKVFVGPVPPLYDRCLGPVLFQPYAEVIAGRLGAADRAILETAAGTGVVTRAVAAAAPGSTITATDLNQAMLDVAADRTGAGNVTWRQADAQSLPFAGAAFDAVICSFGVMFMPDKQKAFGEARRVLRPAGRFIFTLWDRLEENPLSQVASDAIIAMFPEDPPRFMARTPHGYHDPVEIEGALLDAGFSQAAIEPIARDSAVSSARDAAIGLCQGTPMRGEIEARDPEGLGRVTDAVAEAIEARFGAGPFRAPMQALLVTAS